MGLTMDTSSFAQKPFLVMTAAILLGNIIRVHSAYREGKFQLNAAGKKTPSYIAEYAAHSLIKCSAMCIEDGRCKSYSYSSVQSLCQLVDSVVPSGSLLSDVLWKYYEEFTEEENLFRGLGCADYVLDGTAPTVVCEEISPQTNPGNPLDAAVYGDPVVNVRRVTGTGPSQILELSMASSPLGPPPAGAVKLEVSVWIQGCQSPSLTSWDGYQYVVNAWLRTAADDDVEWLSAMDLSADLGTTARHAVVCLTSIHDPTVAKMVFDISAYERPLSSGGSGGDDGICSVGPWGRYIMPGQPDNCP